MVAAARLDNHNHIEDAVFSPRAALVFGPTENHKFRATYNRAFSTPSTNNLFLDLVTAGDLGGIGAATGTDGYDLWAKGVPEGGFTFRRDIDGGIDGLYMQSPFTPVTLGGPPQFLPAEATLMWAVAQGSLLSAGIPGSIIASLGTPTKDDIGTALATLNPTTGRPEAINPAEVRDVGEIQPTITNTFELGYKGTFADRFSTTLDVHHSRIKDFVGPLRVETPWVFFDPEDFAAYMAPAMPQIVGHFRGLGMSLAEATAAATELLTTIGSTPLGTVTPEGNLDPADLILTYRNFGEVELTGFDIGLEWMLDARWTVGGTYSYVDSDYFEDVEGELDLALNAPRHKAGGTLQYTDQDRGLAGGARVRFVDGFPVASGVYVGEVGFYTLLDVNASWRVPGSGSTVLSAQVINALDDKHREFVGVPEIGRVGLVKLTHTF